MRGKICLNVKIFGKFQHCTYSCNPFEVGLNKATSDLIQEEKERCWIRFPLMVFVMVSCHVVALCTTLLYTVCLYQCVLFGMSCYGMCLHRRVPDRHTNSECKEWAGTFYKLAFNVFALLRKLGHYKIKIHDHTIYV